MRLIDANELKKECRSVPDPRGKYAELRIIEDYEIDDAPTIFDTDNATNGEVIKAMFSNAKIVETEREVFLYTGTREKDKDIQIFDTDWWNNPYQKGGNDE